MHRLCVSILHRHITIDGTVIGEHTDLGTSHELAPQAFISIEQFAPKQVPTPAFCAVVMHTLDSNSSRNIREDWKADLGLFGVSIELTRCAYMQGFTC